MSLRDEPLSQAQQRRCRHDGEVEEMHDDAPRRPFIPVTEPEPNGHIRAEAHRATLEQRPARDPYKELPLTGAMQSMMPMYRLPGSFGRIRIPATTATTRTQKLLQSTKCSAGCAPPARNTSWEPTARLRRFDFQTDPRRRRRTSRRTPLHGPRASPETNALVSYKTKSTTALPHA